MRRPGVMVLAVVVVFASVLAVPTGAAGAAETQDDNASAGDVAVTRYGGADRYATSLLIAEAVAAEAGGSLEAVVLVSGERWTDAVVAAPLAGSLGAPVLMTPADELRADAVEFLERYEPSRVLLVGSDEGLESGEEPFGEAVILRLLEMFSAVEVVSGADRYATGALAARTIDLPGDMPGFGRTAIVASGEVFADALVAGPFAARGHHPVMLTPPGELHAEVAQNLSLLEISHVVLMGGTAALSVEVEQSIKDLGIAVTRLAGATRYDTAVKAAELVTDRYSDTAGTPCFATSTIGMARARVPFDSFSAAPLLGRLCAPLVLADPAQVPADTATFIDAVREANPAVDLRVFGGDAAVSQSAIETYRTGAEPDTGDDEEAGEAEEEEEEPDEGEADEPGVLPAGSCGGSIDDEPEQLVPSTNAEDAAWSPDCSRLVYTQDGALWTVNNDGSGRKRLVPAGDGYRHSAVWSPLGDRIAYVRAFIDDGHWDSHIWTVNVDGSHNNQRTEGDVVDRRPTWSPDGKKIAFERISGSGRNEQGHRLDSDRYIVVMTSYGNKPQALNTGGSWEHSPTWSPDGNQLAYVVNGTIVVSDTDGSNPRRVQAGAFFEGGVSWSPDGERLAFVRASNEEEQIVIADVTGFNEEIVFAFDGHLRAPRWSPDGQLLAFHTIGDDSSHRVYVAGASGDPGVDGASDCRPGGASGTTTGFPLPSWAAPSMGTLRVAVLFMDFPDAEASHTTEDEAAQGLPYVEDYLESVSRDQLDVETVAHHSWLRSEQEFGSFVSTNALNNQAVNAAAISHAIDLAAPDFDFSDIHSVMVVLAGNHFGGRGFAHPSITAGEGTWPSSLINSVHLGEERTPYTWGSVAAHELSHSLGLSDLYPYSASAHTRPDAPDGKVWVASEWGRMNMWAYFLADDEDPRLAHDWVYPDDVVSTAYRLHLRIEEMLAWSRWQLGWLSESQVSCVSDPETELTLSPIAAPGDGIAMAAVPISSHEMIVIESRRKLGYDAGEFYEASDTGAHTTFPRLITEGVLVYTVDSLRPSGTLPLRVAGDSGDGQVDDFPMLEAGDSVTVRGYTITVTADDGETHTVTITRDP